MKSKGWVPDMIKSVSLGEGKPGGLPFLSVFLAHSQGRGHVSTQHRWLLLTSQELTMLVPCLGLLASRTVKK
jgi:hypothetical protein